MSSEAILVPRMCAVDPTLSDRFVYATARNMEEMLATGRGSGVWPLGTPHEQETLQILATDRPGFRLLAKALGTSRYYATVEEAAAGENYPEIAVECSLGGCVQVWAIDFVEVRKGEVRPDAYPTSVEGKQLFDMQFFVLSDGSTGIVSVHATALDVARKYISEFRRGKTGIEDQIEWAQETTVRASTEVRVEVFKNQDARRERLPFNIGTLSAMNDEMRLTLIGDTIYAIFSKLMPSTIAPRMTGIMVEYIQGEGPESLSIIFDTTKLSEFLTRGVELMLNYGPEQLPNFDDYPSDGWSPEEIQQAIDNSAEEREKLLPYAPVSDVVDPVRVEWSAEFNSAPAIVYLSPEQIADIRGRITTEGGVTLPWDGEPVVLTKGREGIRVMIFRAFGYLIACHERQLSAIPIFVENSEFRTDSVICNAEITLKVIEASSLLLRANGDYAVVHVCTPETTAATTNGRVMWFVSEGNIPHDRVEAAYQVVGDPELAFKSKGDAITYLSQSWRNFVHVRYLDGTQAVIMNPRMREAYSIAKPPMGKAKLGDPRGAGQMAEIIRLTARDAVFACLYNATLRDAGHGAGGAPENGKGARPVFFDPEGTLRYSQLRAVIEENFSEHPTLNGQMEFSITPDFMSTLDSMPARNVQYVNSSPLKDLILSGKVTGAQVYSSFMERFLRAAIGAIYIYYGQHGYTAMQLRRFRLQLSHVIYRATLKEMQRRDEAFALLSQGYQWLCAKIGPPPKEQENADPFVTVFRTAQYHAKMAKADGRAKDLLISYVMNRSAEKFMDLEPNIRELYSQWIAEQVHIPLPAESTVSGAHFPKRAQALFEEAPRRRNPRTSAASAASAESAPAAADEFRPKPRSARPTSYAAAAAGPSYRLRSPPPRVDSTAEGDYQLRRPPAPAADDYRRRLHSTYADAVGKSSFPIPAPRSSNA